MTCCHISSEMLLTIKNGEPINGHTEPCGDHCIFWQCTVENPIFTPHEGSVVLPKQTNCTCPFYFGWWTYSLSLVWCMRDTARVRESAPTITPCKMDGVWSAAREHIFIVLFFVPQLTMVVSYCTNHLCYHK
jgi:hypothetical protein